ncbi:hypothetical protein B296_00034869, partial [Ensete ventricosum]
KNLSDLLNECIIYSITKCGSSIIFSPPSMNMDMNMETENSINRVDLRKLSLDYLQTSISRGEHFNESKTKKHRMGKVERGYSSVARLSQQTPLSKNDMNYIRRSQV